MKGYELKVTLSNCTHETSRTIIVPETLSFAELSNDLRIIFDLTFLKPSLFKFPGINTPLWDENDQLLLRIFLTCLKNSHGSIIRKTSHSMLKLKKQTMQNNIQ